MRCSSLISGIIITCLTFIMTPAKADEYFTHNRVAISGSLTSSDTYTLELSYHRMFCPYIGVGAALGYWANYYKNGWAAGYDWQISDEDNNPCNFYLHPSIVLKSPGIKLRDVSLGLYAEPGLMLNIPYRRVCIERARYFDTDYDYISTTGGQWTAFELRLGISADIGPYGITLGYTMSNFDIYSQYRHLSYRGTSFRDFYPHKPFMQGIYLTLSYNL